MTKPDRTPSECPVCGTDVPPKARACPQCGADERTGWDEEATRYDGLDLPEASFERDEVLKDIGLKPRLKPKGVPAFWWMIGLGMLVLMILLIFRGGFI